MTAPLGSAEAPGVPEIGPSLGRLTDPPSGRVAGPLGVTLDDLRLDLVTRIFELAGASRQFAAAGDREGAVQSLGRTAWLTAWEQAVAAAAARLTETVNAGFRAAAAESRLPAARLNNLLLTADDTHAMAARLGGGGADFVAALDTLEPAAVAAARTTTHPAASSGDDRSRAAWRAWQDALGAAARRLESAWLALLAATAAEERRWQNEIARVRAWRRPAWPLWLVATAVLAAATYLGLVLGGYLPVPTMLQGFADFVWSLGWI